MASPPDEDGRDVEPRDGHLSTRPDGAGTPGRGGSATVVAEVLGRELKSALARWVLKKRRDHRAATGGGGGDGRDAALDPKDEATHDWDGRRRFAEDYAFVAVRKDWALIARLEWLPGRDSQRVWVAVLDPSGVHTLEAGQQIVRGGATDRWRAGGLELDCVRPFRRWALRYVGRLFERGIAGAATNAVDPGRRCSIDLTYVSDADPYWPGVDDDPELIARHLGEASWDSALLRGFRRTRARGYVQVGDLIGTIAHGDSLMPVRVPCLRQHSWGVRDWGATDRAFQCFVALDDGQRAFVHNAEFPFVTLEGGFVRAVDGARRSVRSMGATIERRPDRAPARASLHLEHERGGQTLELTTVSETSLVVDGRGRLDFALCDVATAAGDITGSGLLVQQCRVLPRR